MEMKNIAIITLDAKTTSALDWTKARTEALQKIATGKKILWHLDFGCFRDFMKPISNQEQFLALTLAVDHFISTLSNEFRSYSKGMLIYQGPADFAETIPVGEIEGTDPLERSLKARNIASDYLQQLITKLPDTISAYIAFDRMASDALITDLSHDPSAYGRLKILPDAHSWSPEADLSTGLLMPPMHLTQSVHLESFRNVDRVIDLQYKKIPESRLIHHWSGLDRLYYVEGALSSQGRRQLQGFIAAGGEVVTL
jgi:hypothetical protein